MVDSRELRLFGRLLRYATSLPLVGEVVIFDFPFASDELLLAERADQRCLAIADIFYPDPLAFLIYL